MLEKYFSDVQFSTEDHDKDSKSICFDVLRKNIKIGDNFFLNDMTIYSIFLFEGWKTMQTLDT